MTEKKPKFNLLKEAYDLMILLISMAGYVPKNATVPRALIMIASIGFVVFLTLTQPGNANLAIFYFLISEAAYIGFISVVLSGNGLRNLFIRRFGNEDNGYQAYETFLGFLFFHNAASIGYIASSSTGDLFSFINKDFLLVIVTMMFISGFIIKITAAKAVSIDIYYWKDMFMGRKISEFVVTGPYKYFSNPMYGIGQIQGYATAIWYGSEYGLLAAILNQALIFTFYYAIEKKFINRVYLKTGDE